MNTFVTSIKSPRAVMDRMVSSALLKEFVLLALSTVSLQFGMFVVNLIAARILGPTQWGLWYLLSLIPAYGCSVHFGVLNGMNRDIPIFRGRGDELKVVRIQQAALSFTMLTSLIAVIGILIAAVLVRDTRLRSPLCYISVYSLLHS